MLDGDLIVPADGEAITMRRRLGRDGLVVVALDGKLRPTIATMGVPLDEDLPEFVAEATADIAAAIKKLSGSARKDSAAILESSRVATRRAAQRWSGKRPQVKVIFAEG